MRKLLCLAIALASLSTICSAQTITETFGSGANAFSMDFVTIGNPGNAADTTGSPNPVGSVAYTYNIGKYEVSRDMINKANAAGNLGITLYDMTYYDGNGLNRPANGISWNEAARFVNYLNTSRGYQAAYNFTTSGANDNITLWGAGQYSGSNRFRHKDTYYFLPSMDEWYKAAFGSPTGNWYDYATGSDAEILAVSSGTEPGTVVYTTHDKNWNVLFAPNGPSDIANAGGLSPYGTMAQQGNVNEWLESAFDGSNNLATEDRVTLGGAWGNFVEIINSSSRFYLNPQNDFTYDLGFRVASVPEPSSLSLFALAGVVVAFVRRKRV